MANAALLDEELRDLLSFCRREAYTPHRAVCAAQILVSYQIARDAQRWELPILEHRQLVHLGTGEAIADYLAARLPRRLHTLQLADRVLQHRNSADLAKAAKYRAMEVEEFCQQLIRRLLALHELFL
jgi:hypothetical protein